MGLNFRKSISLIPGVKLNLSKGGVGLSAGVPGFRKSINTKGQVGTTISIPGTGIYYTDKKQVTDIFGGKKKTKEEKAEKKTKETKTKKTAVKEETPVKSSANKSTKAAEPEAAAQDAPSYTPAYAPSAPAVQSASNPTGRQIDENMLKNIYKTADDTVDWEAVSKSPTPPNEFYNQQMWSYYHSISPKILSGDIDAYLQLIYEVNPLDDLIEYGSAFEFGTDTPDKMAVEYTVDPQLLSESKKTLSTRQYNELLLDFVSSLSIRIARDMFALLPVSHVTVYTVMDKVTILSVDFDKEALSQVQFGFIDPSDTVERFHHSMKFHPDMGFFPVVRTF